MSDLLWEKTKKTLQAIMPEYEYAVWINPLEGNFKEKNLEIFCPNLIIKEHLTNKLSHYIFEAARKTIGEESINLKIKTKAKRNTKLHFQNPIDFATGVNRLLTFNNFVKGQSNEFAYAFSKSISKEHSDSQTLFVFGESSIGKTHLLNAIANEVLANDPDKKVLLVYTKDFVKDIVLAIQQNHILKLSDKLSNLDVLLIDDIHLIAGKERTQEEFFHIFKRLLDRGKKVIFVGDTYPAQVEGLEPRVRNRVLAGPVAFIELPEYETRLGILKEFAKREGIEHLIPEEAYFELAQRIKKHARVLQSMIHTIKSGLQYAKIKQTASPETILNIVRANLEQETVKSFSLDRIKKVICAYYNLSSTELLSNTRVQRIARPRQIAMYLARKYTDISLSAISHQFNRKEHATVINACNKIESKIKSIEQSDATLRQEISQIELILRR